VRDAADTLEKEVKHEKIKATTTIELIIFLLITPYPLFKSLLFTVITLL